MNSFHNSKDHEDSLAVKKVEEEGNEGCLLKRNEPTPSLGKLCLLLQVQAFKVYLESFSLQASEASSLKASQKAGWHSRRETRKCQLKPWWVFCSAFRTLLRLLPLRGFRGWGVRFLGNLSLSVCTAAKMGPHSTPANFYGMTTTASLQKMLKP